MSRQDLDPGTVTALQDAMSDSLRGTVRDEDGTPHRRKRDRSTNWNVDPDFNGRGKQPAIITFGEGLGIQMPGFSTPKYHAGQLVSEAEPEAPELTDEEKVVRREAITAKSRRTREKNKARKVAIAAKERAGEALQGARVFRVTAAFDDWEERSKRLGGIPEGVDIAATEFANLLIVPVIEEPEAKKLGLTEPFRDIEGRNFWVPTERREHVNRVFGGVDWSRPLTKREAGQFGITLRTGNKNFGADIDVDTAS